MLEMNDGYPTEATLETVRTWDPADGWGLLEALAEIWHYDSFIRVDRTKEIAHVSTAGWSGHEDLIEAMRENRMWWTWHWESHRRGGHYEFRPRVQGKHGGDVGPSTKGDYE